MGNHFRGDFRLSEEIEYSPIAEQKFGGWSDDFGTISEPVVPEKLDSRTMFVSVLGDVIEFHGVTPKSENDLSFFHSIEKGESYVGWSFAEWKSSGSGAYKVFETRKPRKAV